EELPGLVCFRSGAVVGRAPLSQFGAAGGALVEEEVTAYLRRLRVLRGEQQAGRGGRAADTEDDGSKADEEEAEEWRVKPCELCGRSYPHEHVRAVYGADRRRADSSGDEED
ncbi:hypothetical protein Agub_g12996, partial [Astrephomene gubernaculifera]